MNGWMLLHWIRNGKLNTLVNKFMGVSRIAGLMYIGGATFEKTASTFYFQNEVGFGKKQYLNYDFRHLNLKSSIRQDQKNFVISTDATLFFLCK